MSNLRVLIVDDTVTYRKLLSDIVNSLPDMEVIATASHGRIALAKMKQERPDIVLLDMVMPEMDGLETLKRIKEEYPDTGVIMVSGSSAPQAEDTLKALQLGAIDFISKPESRDFEANYKELTDKLRPLLGLFMARYQVRKIGRQPKQKERKHEERITDVSPPLTFKCKVPSRISALLIGVSTGGPNALAEVIPKLPAELKVPVLIVQHMPPLFTASLAEQLAKKSFLPVVEAKDGEMVVPGKVFIAPGGRHMCLSLSKGENGSNGQVFIQLSDTPPVNSCRPSVDVLFRSAAVCYPGKTLAVILTGMGEDGADGVRLLRRNGCYCLAQNEETCVVYGMPRAVVESGLADEVLPLNEIAERIKNLVAGEAENAKLRR